MFEHGLVCGGVRFAVLLVGLYVCACGVLNVAVWFDRELLCDVVSIALWFALASMPPHEVCVFCVSWCLCVFV